MDANYFKRLLAHDQWANALYAEALSRAPGLPQRAYELLAHIVGTEWTWLSRMRRLEAPLKVWPGISPEQCLAELPKLKSHWEALLTSTDLASSYAYTNTKGEPFESTVRDTLTHVFLHSHYHRGQIGQTMRQAGIAPPNTDFIVAARQQILG